MDTSRLMGRVKGILLSPRNEWPVIATEPASIKGVYVPHVLVLAALPAVAGFIRNSLIGHGAFGIHVRVPVLSGIVSMLVGYVLSLVLLFVVALIVNALAPSFDGRKNQLQALKTVAYAWTAAWLAGAAVIVPWLGWIIALLGGVYSIYLLYLGLPHTMQCPRAKAGVYTLVTVIITVVLSWLVGLVVAGFIGVAALGGAVGSSGSASSMNGVTVDKDSRLGALLAVGKQIQAAGEAAQQAEASGKDDVAKAEAVRDAYATLLTGRTDGKPVESMAPGELKAFLPESLGDWQRKSLSAKREGGLGMQITTVRAQYARDDSRQRITVSLMDIPALGGAMRLAKAFASEVDNQSEHGYEKKYASDGRRIHEKWDSRNRRGEFSSSFGGHYQVEVKGAADSMDELKQVAARIDLEGVVRAGGK